MCGEESADARNMKFTVEKEDVRGSELRVERVVLWHGTEVRMNGDAQRV
jgi:hypothetical protein